MIKKSFTSSERESTNCRDKGERRVTADFSLETLEARREWNNRTEKQRQKCHPMIPSTVEMSHENEDKQ